tara:strand:+ start:9247 stop:9588 length:342 start_codon:yes stop_codon:yes gene_type:complete
MRSGCVRCHRHCCDAFLKLFLAIFAKTLRELLAFHLVNRFDTGLVVELELGQLATVKPDHLAFATNVELKGLIRTLVKMDFLFVHTLDAAPRTANQVGAIGGCSLFSMVFQLF